VLSKEGALTQELKLDELSKLTQKPFYASDGWVELAKDGTVFSEKPFVKLEKGVASAGPAHTPGNAKGVEEVDFVRLGVREVNTPGNIAQSLTGALKNTYDDIIKFGGSAVENNGVLKLLNKNGDEIAEIANGKILPSKYFDDAVHSGATPIGQPANGYQVFKKGDDFVVKRMPDKSAYSQAELTELTQHPDAHVLERHGHDVTDEALIKRANSGIAPDGSTTYSGAPPPYSSKFESPEKLVDALDNTKPGTNAFSNGVQQGKIKKVTYVTSSGNFGKGIPRNGNTFQTTNKVLAIYEDMGNGNYKLLTMYPDF
jgi:hypothetical protein